MERNYIFFGIALFCQLHSCILGQKKSGLKCLNPEIFNEGEYELQNKILHLGKNLTVSGGYYEFNGTQVRACLCKIAPCLRKCCPANEVFDLSKRKCESGLNGNSTGFGYDVFNEDRLLPSFTIAFQKVYGLKCPNKKYVIRRVNDSEDAIHIQMNGSLWWRYVNGNGTQINIFDSDIFCMERFTRNNEFRFVGAFVCFPKTNEEISLMDPNPEFTIYPIGMIISSPFLLITILVHALIPELRNIHGKYLICHTTSLLNLYIFLIIVQIQGASINPTFCGICGYILQFSFLSTFFWLNILCIDIWWTFSEIRGVSRSSQSNSKRKNFKKFIIYSCYGWGGPTVILIITLILDLHPDIPDYIIAANVGKKRCLVDVDNRLSALIYLYGPVGILLFLNILLFLWTITKLFISNKKSEILSGEESRQSKDTRRQFILYLKLFIVMGINWLAEFISWAIEGPNWIWWAPDILNSLQGIYIFAIFVNNPRSRKLILLKFCPRLVQQNGNTITLASSLRSSSSSSKKNCKNTAELKLLKTKR